MQAIVVIGHHACYFAKNSEIIHGIQGNSGRCNTRKYDGEDLMDLRL